MEKYINQNKKLKEWVPQQKGGGRGKKNQQKHGRKMQQKLPDLNNGENVNLNKNAQSLRNRGNYNKNLTSMSSEFWKERSKRARLKTTQRNND